MVTGVRSVTRSVRCPSGRGQWKCAGTRAETRFRPSAQQTGPFKSAGASVQSTTGSRVVRISGNNAGYTKFRGSVKGTGYYFIREFPLHFPSRALPCAITFQLHSTHCTGGWVTPRAGLSRCGKSLFRRDSIAGQSNL